MHPLSLGRCADCILHDSLVSSGEGFSLAEGVRCGTIRPHMQTLSGRSRPVSPLRYPSGPGDYTILRVDNLEDRHGAGCMMQMMTNVELSFMRVR